MSLGAVLICKEYSDSYKDAFLRRGFTPYFLQVLETRLVNEDLLKQTIHGGPGTRYHGIIITSSRAANAWVSCVKDGFREQPDTLTGSWESTPFYVVGKATETAVRACDELLPGPLQVLGAEKAGTGEKLAQFIVQSYRESKISDEEQGSAPKLLYLTGDKHRETIPDILTKAGLGYHKMQVYETLPVLDLSNRLAEAIESIQEVIGLNTKLWIALFSPSTASYVLEALKAPSAPRESSFSLAAIGPTTEEYLRSSGYQVSAMSSKPDADSLGDAICLASNHDPLEVGSKARR